MSLSPFIYIPKKKTYDADFSSNLKTLIPRIYGQDASQFAEDISILNKAREDAVRGTPGSDATGRDLLYRYYMYLEQVAARFSDLSVPFSWDDAFTKTKVTQTTIAFEKAAVIFNAAATLSSLAASSPRTSQDEIKALYHIYRTASGHLKYINDNFLHAPSSDMNRDVLKVLITIMNAQATEVFIESMAPGAKLSNLRSKLLMLVSQMYSGIIDESKTWTSSGVFSRDWINLIQCKANYFQSLAHFHRAIADEAAMKYGDNVGRLIKSETLAKEAVRNAQSFAFLFSSSSSSNTLNSDSATNLTEMTKTHLASVTAKRKAAERENDLIYHATVTSEASLPPIEKSKEVAIPIPSSATFETEEARKVFGAPIFAKLVPMSVYGSESIYSEEKAKISRSQTELVEIADTQLATALEFMNLPISLEKYKDEKTWRKNLSDPGAKIWEYSEELYSIESSSSFSSVLDEMERLGVSLLSRVEDISLKLSEEETFTESLKQRYQYQWTQPASGLSNGAFKDDLKSRRTDLENAKGADQRAREAWQKISGDIYTLMDSAKLQALFANAAAEEKSNVSLLDLDDSSDDFDLSAKVSAISSSLAELNTLKKNRSKLVDDLRHKIQIDDISESLAYIATNSAEAEQALFQKELKKYNPITEELSKNVQAQKDLLDKISSDFEALKRSQQARDRELKWNSAVKKRDDLVADLQDSYNTYKMLRKALESGKDFYAEIERLIRSLEYSIGNYLQQRKQESTYLLASLSGTQGSAPPTAQPSASMDTAFQSLSLGASQNYTSSQAYPPMGNAPLLSPQHSGIPAGSYSGLPPPPKPLSYNSQQFPPNEYRPQ